MTELDDSLLNLGLHQLKDKFTQKELIKEHCEWLLRDDHFSTVVAKTRQLSPKRDNPFVLSRKPNENMHENSRERILEYAVYKRWSKPDRQLSSKLKLWENVFDYQVPIYAGGEQASLDSSWGDIDAIGVYRDSLVVIELKREPSTKKGITSGSDTPLKILLQSTAYAIALQENIKNVVTSANRVLEHQGLQQRLLDQPKIKLVGAVPAAYWLNWLPVTARGKKELNVDVWSSFYTVVDKIKKDLDFEFAMASIVGIPHKLSNQGDYPNLCVQALPYFRKCVLSPVLSNP